MRKTVSSKRSVCLILILAWFWCIRLPAQDHEDGDHGAPNETEVSPVDIGVGGNIRLENRCEAELHDPDSLEVHLLWESRYVTEGRDNLDGGGLASLSSDFSLGDFTFAPWLAYGYDSRYNDGYVVDGHDGLNHAQLSLRLAWYPLSGAELSSYAAYNFAIDSEPERFAGDTALHDFFWAGIGIALYF